MNFTNLQQLVRPASDSGWQALIPVVTVLISGLVIILALSPAYLRELHPLTLLLLSVSCALPAWALNQLLWWHIGRRISAAVVSKLIYVLDVPEQHRRSYSFALSELLKAVDILRFVPYQNLANLMTVISIYIAAALAYLLEASAVYLYGGIVSLSLLAWLLGLLLLNRAFDKVDVEPLRDLWHQLKDTDELLAAISRHFERMEALLLTALQRGEGEQS